MVVADLAEERPITQGPFAKKSPIKQGKRDLIFCTHAQTDVDAELIWVAV